eukprot:COSAG02_NODE_12140_length_1591_cov_1.051609_1_plen_237_part_00
MDRSIVAAPRAEACDAYDEDAEEEVCCVCLETLRSKRQQRPESLLVTECGHTFHFRCILNSCRQRKQQEPTCPLCRHTLELGPLLLAVKPESVPAPQPRAGAGGRSGEGQLRPPRIVSGQGTNTRPQIQRWRYHFATGVIKGVVSSYPGHEDGSPISTSRVATAEGESCVTQSGSRYELGDPDPEWQQQMERRGLWDTSNPLSQLALWKRERETHGSTLSAEVDVDSDTDEDSDPE